MRGGGGEGYNKNQEIRRLVERRDGGKGIGNSAGFPSSSSFARQNKRWIQ